MHVVTDPTLYRYCYSGYSVCRIFHEGEKIILQNCLLQMMQVKMNSANIFYRQIGCRIVQRLKIGQFRFQNTFLQTYDSNFAMVSTAVANFLATGIYRDFEEREPHSTCKCVFGTQLNSLPWQSILVNNEVYFDQDFQTGVKACLSRKNLVFDFKGISFPKNLVQAESLCF